jgi:hypothetical protein
LSDLLIILVGIGGTPVPSFQVVLVGVYFLSLHGLADFVKILDLPSDLDLAVFLYFSHDVSPRRRNFPELG